MGKSGKLFVRRAKIEKCQHVALFDLRFFVTSSASSGIVGTCVNIAKSDTLTHRAVHLNTVS